ncbi:SusD/RagB family nutrient-binding outer membrane lipoprotein [Sphingobacterium sp. UDSM-2020]|uniref:SusD/RagB family nutrient-binding outer membrane lipoprotein n=1 Tax=Sphingobacterium sp. UDSM-2020 TaxID=2795738 RepID=UPI0019390147|nr:SusD/RagB family nutrient-binding outer membrane lipoprotein [Sphingobacterium sp. UDSM-2020]QQD15630.1 SusD/RagB family nutrient-binding outer membrane lipoprotein [Sphingobacterium sp. UDSM-2020]
MKKFFIAIVILQMFFLASCTKGWLDINDNPNNPNTSVPTVDLRLPSILAQFVDGYESAGTRGALVSQQLVSANNSANNWNLTQWNITSAAGNWPYQSWYVYCGVNIPDLLKAAEKVGANHYYGAGKIIWAWGFTNLADMYGMVPFDEAFVGGNMTPKYNQGDYIYEKALQELEVGIQYLQKQQGESAPSLSKGDYLYQGDVQKWIKLAYGLKARLLNHLSKTDKYNPSAILESIEKAPLLASESAIYQYQDELVSTNASTNSLQYANNNTNRLSQLYINYILNKYTGAPSGGGNVEDPRALLLIPNIISKGVQNRTVGVDLSTLSANGFPSSEPKYAALRAVAETATVSGSTGTWYTTKGAKGLLLTNSEMYFIRAEVYFKQNNKVQALQAYKDGIKAHCELLGVNSSNFLGSTSVVQDANLLTLSQIMIQKYIALSYSPEMFNDVRRMNFCTDKAGNYDESQGIYKGFIRPSFAYNVSFPNQTMWPRRFNVPTYGIQYNLDQVLKSDPDAQSVTYMAKPVFWDK